MIFTMNKIDFSKSYQNFLTVFFLGMILFPECIIPYHFLKIMDILDILFFTNTDIDIINFDRLFLQVRLKWYSERYSRCPRKK